MTVLYEDIAWLHTCSRICAQRWASCKLARKAWIASSSTSSCFWQTCQGFKRYDMSNSCRGLSSSYAACMELPTRPLGSCMTS